MKPVTGQYECVHSSAVGLDYFTARIDTLTLFADGRFTLKVQQQSRASHAARSFIQGQQVNTNAPESVMEGTYTLQGVRLQLFFPNGGIENGQIDADEAGLMLGPNHFTKISDSTSLPSTHRMQQNMDDIAKGLKIAGAIGGLAVKAAKTIQSTIQTTQGQPSNNGSYSQNSAAASPASSAPGQSYQPPQQSYGTPPQSPPMQGAQQRTVPPVNQPQYTPPSTQQQPPIQPEGSLYCDQCGAHVRPGKRFCSNCGARLS